MGPMIGMPGRVDAQEKDIRTDPLNMQQTSTATLQEVLEFLGHWETDQGGWIDPSDLDWLLDADQDMQDDEGK